MNARTPDPPEMRPNGFVAVSCAAALLVTAAVISIMRPARNGFCFDLVTQMSARAWGSYGSTVTVTMLVLLFAVLASVLGAGDEPQCG